MISHLLMVGGLLLFVLPGVIVWRHLFPTDAAEECWGMGAALGVALSIYLAYVSAFASVKWFWPIWGAVVVLTLFGCRKSLLGLPRPSIPLVLILASVTALQLF